MAQKLAKQKAIRTITSERSTFTKLLSTVTEEIVVGQETRYVSNIYASAPKNRQAGSPGKNYDTASDELGFSSTFVSDLLDAFKVVMRGAEELVSLRWGNEGLATNSFPKSGERIFSLNSLLTERVEVVNLFGLSAWMLGPGESLVQKRQLPEKKTCRSDAERLFAHLSHAARDILPSDANAFLAATSHPSVPYASYAEWEKVLRWQVGRFVEASNNLEKELLFYHHFPREWSVEKKKWEKRVKDTVKQLKLYVMLIFLKRLQDTLREDFALRKGLIHAPTPYLHARSLFLVSPLSVTDMPTARAKYGLLYTQSELSVRAMRANYSFPDKLKVCLKQELLPLALGSEKEPTALGQEPMTSTLLQNLTVPLEDLAEASEVMLKRLREAWTEAQDELHQHFVRSSGVKNHTAVGEIYNIWRRDGGKEGTEDINMPLYQTQYAFPLLTGASKGDPASFFLCLTPVQLDLVEFQSQLLARLEAERQERQQAYLQTGSHNTTHGLPQERQAKTTNRDSSSAGTEHRLLVIPAVRWENMYHNSDTTQMAQGLHNQFYQNRPTGLQTKLPSMARALFSFGPSDTRRAVGDRTPQRTHSPYRKSPATRTSPIASSSATKQFSAELWISCNARSPSRQTHTLEQSVSRIGWPGGRKPIFERFPHNTVPKQDMGPLKSPQRSDSEVTPKKVTKPGSLLISLDSSNSLPTLSGTKKSTNNISLSTPSMQLTSSRPVSGGLLPYIKLEEANSETSELSIIGPRSAIVANETVRKQRDKPGENNKLTLSPGREARRTTSLALIRSANTLSPRCSVRSEQTLAQSDSMWKVVSELCPSLSEEVVPGIYLQDLHESMLASPKMRSLINQLSMNRSENGNSQESLSLSANEQLVQMLSDLLKTSARELCTRTLQVKEEMSFLPYRVNTILLANLRPWIEQDPSFQSLYNIRHHIICGAGGMVGGISSGQRLDKVEQSLRDTASKLARGTGLAMISTEKSQTSIATLSRLTLDAYNKKSNKVENVRPSASSIPDSSPAMRYSTKPPLRPITLSPSTLPFPSPAKEGKGVCPMGSRHSNNVSDALARGGHRPLSDLRSSITTHRPHFVKECTGSSTEMETSFPPMAQQTPQDWKTNSNQQSMPLYDAMLYSRSTKTHSVNTGPATRWGNRTLPASTPHLSPFCAGQDEGNFSLQHATYPHACSAAMKGLSLSSCPTKTPRCLSLRNDNTVEAAADTPAANPSLREVYQQACLTHMMRPNTGLLNLLPAERLKRLACLDLSANYVGAKGVIALLEVIKYNGDALTTLRLSHNNLQNTEVMEVVDVLFNTSAGDSLTNLDLSYNPISRASGQAILDLCNRRPKIKTICLNGTSIPRELLKSIIDTLEKN